LEAYWSFHAVADKKYFLHRLITPNKCCVSSQMPDIAGTFGIASFLCQPVIFPTLPVPPICTLVFTFTQNPVSIVSSFLAHGISPLNEKSQTCDIIISQIWLFV